MSHPEGLCPLSEWTDTVGLRMPHLSKAEARVLALFSFGMVIARSSAISAVSVTLACLLSEHPNTVRQRLREFCYEAENKRGTHRNELDVASCFAPLLSWIVSLWPDHPLAMALDATSLSDRFAVLVISVVYNGCAIPVAWKVLPKTESLAWKKEWLRLLRLLHRSVPPGLPVLVMADRGLYARWLFRRIVRLGWHPLLRVNVGGSFRPSGKARFLPLSRFAPTPGTCWAGGGTAFRTPDRSLRCTLLARFDEGHEGPWLVLTDLPEDQVDALWYGLRAWIERGFKSTKRGGFQWQNTRMQDPLRAERLWLCVAVATLWLLSVAGEAEASVFAPIPAALPGTTPPKRPGKTRLRLCGLFRLGLAYILTALVYRQPILPAPFRPTPWPKANVTTNHEPITYP